MRLLVLILFLLLLQFCTVKDNEIQNKWTSSGGALIIDLRPDGSMKLTSHLTTNNFSKWEYKDDILIFIDTVKNTQDSLLVVFLSKDSLFLDTGVPRGIAIKKCYKYIPPKIVFEKDDIFEFISGNTFNVKNCKDTISQNITFNKNGTFITNEKESEWEIILVEDFVLLVITNELNRKSISKVIAFEKNKISLETYSPNDEGSYFLEMIKL